MEHYLRFRPLRGFMDALGTRVLLLALSVGWFTYLWGLGWAAAIAGCALAMLLNLALRRGRGRLIDRREDALRRRLGGEMALEDLLLCPEHQAHLRCAMLLGARYDLTQPQITDSGVICRQGREKLLVACLRIPPESELSPGALLPLARAVREVGAERGVACITGRTSKAAEDFAQTLPVSLRIIDGATLIALGGAACPASDEQLIALGRRRRRVPLQAVADVILHPTKTRRYLACGLMLAALYAVTRLRWYPVPAVTCLLLAALCRIRPRLPERL